LFKIVTLLALQTRLRVFNAKMLVNRLLDVYF